MSAIAQRLRPSSAHRWLACPASPSREARVPEGGEPSFYAAEGSAAHELAELCFGTGTFKQPEVARKFLGTTFTVEGFDIPVTAEMADAVQRYVDYVLEFPMQWRAAEYALSMEGILPVGGTSDMVGIEKDGKTLHVFDLKYGQGVKVHAEQNPQLMLYALGALREVEALYDEIERVVVHIVQPRIDHVDTWETTPAELCGFAAHVAQGVERALGAEPPAVPGDHCKFCSYRAHCGERGEHNLQMIGLSFDDLTEGAEAVAEKLQPPAYLSTVDLGLVLEHAKQIRDWLGDLEERAMQEIMDGGEVPGWKLVEGRSSRKWNADEEVVIAHCKKKRLKVDQFMPRELASVAGLEKELGKARFVDLEFPFLVDKGEGKPTLAPASDKRPALSFSAPVEAFDDLTQAEPSAGLAYS